MTATTTERPELGPVKRTPAGFTPVTMRRKVTDNLALVLVRLADFTEYQVQIKGQVMGALL